MKKIVRLMVLAAVVLGTCASFADGLPGPACNPLSGKCQVGTFQPSDAISQLK